TSPTEADGARGANRGSRRPGSARTRRAARRRARNRRRSAVFSYHQRPRRRPKVAPIATTAPTPATATAHAGPARLAATASTATCSTTRCPARNRLVGGRCGTGRNRRGTRAVAVTFGAGAVPFAGADGGVMVMPSGPPLARRERGPPMVDKRASRVGGGHADASGADAGIPVRDPPDRGRGALRRTGDPGPSDATVGHISVREHYGRGDRVRRLRHLRSDRRSRRGAGGERAGDRARHR